MDSYSWYYWTRIKMHSRVENLWKERGRMKGNPPPQLPHQEDRDCNTVRTQRTNRAMIPVCNSHVSKALSPYNCKTMLPFTTCHWTMLIFSSQLLTEQFSAPFHCPVLQQRLLLSLFITCRWWTSSFLFYQRWCNQVSNTDKTSWAHGHQETNRRDDSSRWHRHKTVHML